MTNWTTDENGNRTFTHQGWTVSIWNSDGRGSRIDITTVLDGEDWRWSSRPVAGTEEGIWRRPAPPPPAPPAVIGAIIEARAIVG